MQKQIRQQWASHAPLGSALLPRNQPPVLFLHWCFQPALDIENHPLLRSMLLHCPKQEVLRKGIKGTYDTLLIISTSPRRSLLFAFGIPSKADRSTFSGRCIGKVGSFSS